MSKVTIAERIFNVVRDTPGLTEENIHEVMSVDITYKTSTGKSLVYRMLRAKYIRKDRNGRFHAHIDAYKPLPPYKPKKKKPAVQYRESAMMNAYVPPVQVQPEPKPVTGGFLGGLGRRIGAYFK
jgi:hypothetical protein